MLVAAGLGGYTKDRVYAGILHDSDVIDGDTLDNLVGVTGREHASVSRPPSARNGMECELAVQLVPTGEVVSVTVIRSSGNSAFDSSAVNAVKKAGAFPELQKLPSAEFEKNFRRLNLIFKPEDLRY